VAVVMLHVCNQPVNQPSLVVQLVTDASGQLIGPVFKVETVL